MLVHAGENLIKSKLTSFIYWMVLSYINAVRMELLQTEIHTVTDGTLKFQNKKVS